MAPGAGHVLSQGVELVEVAGAEVGVEAPTLHPSKATALLAIGPAPLPTILTKLVVHPTPMVPDHKKAITGLEATQGVAPEVGAAPGGREGATTPLTGVIMSLLLGRVSQGGEGAVTSST